MRVRSAVHRVVATTVTFCCVSCSSTSPARPSVAGHWSGATAVATEQWNVDLFLTETDSIRGHATVVSTPPRFSEAYVVTGTVSADSLRLVLRPVEDADIHIAASVSATTLDGLLWLNQFTGQAHPVSLQRMSPLP